LWENIGSPCLTCQLAAIVYRNSFQSRFQSQLQQWLAQNESESSEEEEYTLFRTKTNQAIQNEQSMLQQRNSTIEQNFGEIKYKATPRQTWNIFENLSSIQKNIQKSSNNLKRSHASLEHSNHSQSDKDDQIIQKHIYSKRLFQDESKSSGEIITLERLPLRNIDMNSMVDSMQEQSNNFSIYARSKQE